MAVPAPDGIGKKRLDALDAQHAAFDFRGMQLVCNDSLERVVHALIFR